MNKDALIATLIGFGVGLIITGLFLVGPSLVKGIPKITLPTIQLSPQKSVTPTPRPAAAELTIDAPLPDAIETEGSILVSGSSPAGATVVIEGPTGDIVVNANENGKYAGTVALSEGKNEIVVTGHAGGRVFRQTVTVFYTPESF